MGYKRGERELVEDEKLKTKGKFYPNLPETLINLTFQLEKCAGQYRGDGYGSFVLKYRDGKLVIDATNRTDRMMPEIEHVSGPFFVVEMVDIDIMAKETMRVESRVDVEGMVSRMSIAFVEETEQEMIWLRKAG